MRHILTLLLLIASQTILAQDETFDYVPDRPGMTPGVEILQKGQFSWEGGMGYQHISDLGLLTNSFNFCNSAFRYGATNAVELQLLLSGLHVFGDGRCLTGLAPITIASKFHVLEGKGWVPSISFLASLELPLGTKEFTPDYVVPSVYAIFMNDLSKRLSLNYSVGLEWNGYTPEQNVFAGVMLCYNMPSGLMLFVENYENFFPRLPVEFNLGCGIAYMVNPHFQIDLTGTANLNHLGDIFSFDIGFAWLLAK